MASRASRTRTPGATVTDRRRAVPPRLAISSHALTLARALAWLPLGTWPRPASGLVIATTGPALSMRRLTWTAEGVVLPALSVATARRS